LHPLSHAPNANADAIGPPLHHPICYSLAVIANRTYDLTIIYHELYSGFARSRVAKYIRDRFLNDTKNCGLHFRRQPSKVGGLHIQQNFDSAAFCEPLKIELKSRL